MPDNAPQGLKNHARFDPPFHFLLLPVATINFLLAIYLLTQRADFRSAWFVVLSAAFVLTVFKIRTYSLQVQDRLIRLEEGLRLASVLPDRLKPRICELTEGQLVAMRFASDGELPGLVETTLANKLTKADIKKAIVVWRPDYFRV
jgi:hypothetical protein